MVFNCNSGWLKVPEMGFLYLCATHISGGKEHINVRYNGIQTGKRQHWLY